MPYTGYQNLLGGANEAAFGPIADSYATKYGIPTDIFRDAIRSASNFDPLYSSSSGKGISGLATDIKGFDPMNVADSFDLAAKAISEQYKAVGDYRQAVKNIWNINSDTGDQPGEAVPDRGVISNGLDSVKSWLKSNAYGAIFILVGIAIILATIWALVSQSSLNPIKAVASK